MKYFFAAMLLVFWMIASIILVITVLGLLVVCDRPWQEIPGKLLSVFEN